jgi:thymidylate synthase (FAD)
MGPSMNVKLIGWTPDPEKLPAMAATLTHSKIKPEDLARKSDKDLSAVLKQVLALGHTSVIEHAVFTFAVSDVSRSLTHQLVRHRIASYSQQSQRYVNLTEPNYVIPPTIAKNTKMKNAYEDTMQLIWEQYNKLLEMKIPAEDARYVLPNATCTNIMVTMNARSLLNFFELRCCLHAQWEIRMLANKMLTEVRKVAPVIFKEAGPLCKTKQICPEKKTTCPLYPK